MHIFKIDLSLFIPVCLLIILGSVVLSSVAPWSYPTHFIYLLFAFLSLFLFSGVDLRLYKALAPYFYVFSLILLVLTLIFGALSRGALRWIDLGLFTIQPAEIVKPFLVLYFAWFLQASNNLKRVSISFLFLLPVAILVFVQPDLGSTLIILAGFAGVIFISGVAWKYIVLVCLLSGLLVPFSWHFLADFQKERIQSFLNPLEDPLGTGYHSIQSIIAVGSGGLFGRGLGQGTQSQLLFLPERHTDFIFAALSEELGLLGSGIVVLAFAAILYRIIVLLKNAQDNFTKTLLGGAFAIIFTQATINIGMNLGNLPITGVPLPFVSSGGSSLIAMSILVGIVSSASSTLKEKSNSSIIWV